MNSKKEREQKNLRMWIGWFILMFLWAGIIGFNAGWFYGVLFAVCIISYFILTGLYYSNEKKKKKRRKS